MIVVEFKAACPGLRNGRELAAKTDGNMNKGWNSPMSQAQKELQRLFDLV